MRIKKVLIISLMMVFSCGGFLPNVSAQTAETNPNVNEFNYVFPDSGALEWTINGYNFSKTDIDNAFISAIQTIPEKHFCIKRQGSMTIRCIYDYGERGSSIYHSLGKEFSSYEDGRYVYMALKNYKSILIDVTNKTVTKDNGTGPAGFWTAPYGYAVGNNFEMFYSTYDIVSNTENQYSQSPKGTILFKNSLVPDYVKSFTDTLHQLFSIDFTLNPNMPNGSDFTFELSLKTKEKLFDGMTFLGLVNDNGLYHWETIPVSSGYIEDYTERLENNKYILTLDNLYLDFTGYEKIIVKVNFKNAFDVSHVDISATIQDVPELNVFLNSFGYTQIADLFDTSKFNYINFTTPLDKYEYRFYVSYFSEKNTSDIFLDYFSTFDKAFIDYGLLSRHYYNESYGQKYLYYSNVLIGKENSNGFWLTHNQEKEMNHFYFNAIYYYENLYYNYSVDSHNKGSIIINNKGNRVDTNLSISPDVHIPTDTIIENIIKQFTSLIDKKLPVINQLADIVNAFKWDGEESQSPPTINIDFDFLGQRIKAPIIDFSFYVQYRDIIFFWIKLSLSIVTLVKVFNNVRSVFGGDS